MKTKLSLMAFAVVFGLLLATHQPATGGAGPQSPRLQIEVAHDHPSGHANGNKTENDLSLTNTEDHVSSDKNGIVRWYSTKDFSIVLPKDSKLTWTRLTGNPNSNTHFFDPTQTDVIESDGKEVVLIFSNHPSQPTPYHIAVRGSPRSSSTATQGKAPTVAYYNYDMMEATLTWDDISGSRKP
jgi:hypothetical protein